MIKSLLTLSINGILRSDFVHLAKGIKRLHDSYERTKTTH